MQTGQVSDIDSLNRKVVALSALIESQANLVKQFQIKIDKALRGKAEEQHNALLWLKNLVDKYPEMESDYNLMKVHFEEVHPRFYDKLDEQGHSLSNRDMRLASFIKMRLTNQEIAFLMNLTHDGIKKAIQRLRKKLNLELSDDLRELVNGL